MVPQGGNATLSVHYPISRRSIVRCPTRDHNGLLTTEVQASYAGPARYPSFKFMKSILGDRFRKSTD